MQTDSQHSQEKLYPYFDPKFNFLQQKRAFQKQPTVFQNQKRLPGVKKAALKRYTRTVGLGFKMPSEVRCRVWILTNEFLLQNNF